MVPHNSDEIEKLLAIAEAPTAKRQPKANPEIDRFIAAFKVHNGKTRIPGYILYYTYFTWKEKYLIPRQSFFRYLSKRFKNTTIRGTKYYFLDPRPFNLTTTGYFLARAYARKESEKAKKR